MPRTRIVAYRILQMERRLCVLGGDRGSGSDSNYEIERGRSNRKGPLVKLDLNDRVALVTASLAVFDCQSE